MRVPQRTSRPPTNAAKPAIKRRISPCFKRANPLKSGRTPFGSTLPSTYSSRYSESAFTFQLDNSSGESTFGSVTRTSSSFDGSGANLRNTLIGTFKFCPLGSGTRIVSLSPSLSLGTCVIGITRLSSTLVSQSSIPASSVTSKWAWPRFFKKYSASVTTWPSLETCVLNSARSATCSSEACLLSGLSVLLSVKSPPEYWYASRMGASNNSRYSSGISDVSSAIRSPSVSGCDISNRSLPIRIE